MVYFVLNETMKIQLLLLSDKYFMNQGDTEKVEDITCYIMWKMVGTTSSPDESPFYFIASPRKLSLDNFDLFRDNFDLETDGSKKLNALLCFT